MSRVFNQVVATYSSFVFIGLVMWDFLVQSSNAGGGAYIHSEAYIKQYPRPLFIYPIRAVLVCFINSFIALIGAAIWSSVVGKQFPGFSWFTIPLSLIMGFVWALTFATSMSYLTTIFRDIGQISLLVFQLIWYLSPVFLPLEIFKNKNLPTQILEWNPIFHYLELFRRPLMENEFPTTTNYIFVVGTILFLAIPAILFQFKAERKVIHYL
jgi:ABC-type polysaccharide/polyol phosphate export permease